MLRTLSVGILLLAPGCTPSEPAAEDKPSYADLVVIYNAEQETLDRLERKRGELVAEHERQVGPDTGVALETLNQILDSARDAAAEREATDAAEAADLDTAVDNALDRTEKAQQAASQLLDTITRPQQAQNDQPTPEKAEAAAAFERELAALDAEIERQRVRVERARQARDAAESQP